MPATPLGNRSLPTGTVTFLFTDIEGSTQLWETQRVAMQEALAHHDAIIREATETNAGHLVKSTGDGALAAFAVAGDAIAACLAAQRALQAYAWHKLSIRSRMALHSGAAEERDGDYYGPALNRTARLMAAGHGGQILLTLATEELVRDQLPADVSLRDLGEHRLKDLIRPERVYQLIASDLPSDFPPLKTLDARPNNLSQQLTSFIGREKELAEIEALLTRARLLTLTGAGGSGKTRLGLQAAADVLDQYADGAWFIELGSLADPGLVPQAVGTVLNVKEEPGRPITQTLAEHLKNKRLLLLLDNCEHLLDACARLADALVRQCRGVQILATSREALGIVGEQNFRVPSLSLPDRSQAQTPQTLSVYESVQLFVDRALLVRPDFAVTVRNAPALASLCHHLDGIPLAIELAAARVRALSVEEIDGKLDQRFRLLTGGSRVALPRQQTLRSLIDWSYDLLRDPEKLLLRRLSVFAGGWVLEAAEQICTGDGVEHREVLDLLTSLSDKSLVLAEQYDEHFRYHLLETVRQYAREKLLDGGGGEALRKRHRDYFLALAEEADPNLLGAAQGEWLRRLEQEHDNLRAALEWSVSEAGSQEDLRMCGALNRFWVTRGHLGEGREWCARALTGEDAAERTVARARALRSAGSLAWNQTDYRAARALLEESLAICRDLGDHEGIARSLNSLGNVALEQGDRTAALAMYEESLAIRREMGDRRGMAGLQVNLAFVAYERGDMIAASALCEEALGVARELGDRGHIADALNTLGNVAIERRELASAQALSEESLAIGRELGDWDCIASSLMNLGFVASLQGDLGCARARYVEGLAIRHERGDRLGTAVALEGLADVVAALGNSPDAARIWGAARRLREEIGSPLSPMSDLDQRVAAARTAARDNAAFDRAGREGRAFTLEQAIEFALAASADCE